VQDVITFSQPDWPFVIASDQPTMMFRLFSGLFSRMVQHIGDRCRKSYAQKLSCCKNTPDGSEPLNPPLVMHTSNPILETHEYLAFQMIVKFMHVTCTGTIYLDVLPSDTVEEFKSNGYPEEGILFDNRFSRVFKGKTLQNGVTLSEHLLGQGSNFTCLSEATAQFFSNPYTAKLSLSRLITPIFRQCKGEEVTF
jgi:hypothetical protein